MNNELTNNKMLIELMKKYLKNPYFDELRNSYGIKKLRKFHDFRFDKIDVQTTRIHLQILKDMFSCQFIINKPIYFPGIGLFDITPEDWSKSPEYTFERDFKRINNIFKKYKLTTDSFFEKIITKNKTINLNAFREEIAQMKKLGVEEYEKGKKAQLTQLKNLEAKTKRINQHLIEGKGREEIVTGKEKIKIELVQKYNGEKTFNKIVEDLHKNEILSVTGYYMSFFNTEEILFSEKLIEDLIIMIAYLELQKNHS